LGGFDVNIGGRKGDKNLQGGETELCVRMYKRFGREIWYDPDAKVAHKIFQYRTDKKWLLERAFWQGYSKRAMEILVPESGGKEEEFLTTLLLHFLPDRLRNTVTELSQTEAKKFVMLGILTVCVGLGYLYAVATYRPPDDSN